ncbi:50S ribosomal protein L29 [Patescibacteria group bacterium]|nr:50S ribosomal protein L29 [Patescibacteria group bacterium]
MEYKELKEKSAKELQKILAEERASLYDLRLKLSVNQLKDMSKVKSVKLEIARILTRLGELNREQKAQ